MLVRSLLLAFGLAWILTGALPAQPVLSYLIPDIGAPGMAVYVEIIAPNTADVDGTNFSASDGIYLNNPADPFRIELVRPEDSTKIVFGPCIVSWYGRLVSTIVFISPDATPNSWDWRQLLPQWRIPFRIRTPNGVTPTDTFYIVQPIPGGDFRTESQTVLGRPPFGVRSRRGALLFDSLILGARTYTVSTDDPDQNAANGNQGYLPLVLLSRGPIRGISESQTRLSLDASGIDGGPGGGGGGGEFCDIVGGGSAGGSGYTGGGRGGNNSPNSYRATGTGSGLNGASLNQTGPGTDGGAYESSGGGTGHPFGASGVGCSSGPNCSPDGARGGASGVSDNRDGAGGGYATEGSSTSIDGNNGGKVHGDSTLVPLAGGSGGAGGNPRNSSFPFTACGGRGGGGGGATAVLGLSIEQLSITANGGDGSGSGSTTSRRGGSGSGGGIYLAAPLNVHQVTIQARGGGQSAPTGKGGDGRTRVDAGNLSALSSTPSPYRGPTMDTLTIARTDFDVEGSGFPGKRILLFGKPSNGIWQILDSTIVGSDSRWRIRVRLPSGASTLYLAAAQREQPSITTRYVARPVGVFSHASGRILRILAAPIEVLPSQLNMGRISCASGSVALDSLQVRNPGAVPISITGGGFLNPASGFTIVRPQPLQAILAPLGTISIVIEYRIQPSRYGVQRDTLVIRGDTPERVLARIPVEITVDSAGVILTDTATVQAISFIDFAEACRGISKDRTFALRLVGNTPTTITSITTGTSLFSVSTPSRTTLGVGDTVHLHLQATPPDVGDYFDTLTIVSTVCNQTLQIPLHVRGVVSQIVRIGAPGGVVDFGNVRVGNSRTLRIGIANPSRTDSVIVQPPLQPSAPFSWQTVPPGLTFPRAIGAGDTLWIDVTFAPTAMGVGSDSLVFFTVPFGVSCPDTARFLLLGQATVSSVVPTKTMLDFGILECGRRRDTLWLKNTGNTTAEVFFPATISGTDTQYFSIVEEPPAVVTLRAGDSVRIIIEARIFPQNPDGIKTATLTVTVRDDSTRTLTIPLRVQQQALVLEFTPQPYVLIDVPVNFTSQSQPPLTVRNLSSVLACIADVRTTRPEIVPLIRTINIPPYSASRDLYFNITPTSLTPIDDTITIILSCPCTDTFKIPIRIIPTINGLAMTPRPLDYGAVPPCTTVRRLLTLRNNDPGNTATIENVSIGGTDSNLFRITGAPWSQLPYSIPPGFSITLEIEFNPAGTRPGPKDAHFAIRYVISGREVDDTVQLSGERTVPIDADSLLDFGEVKQGDSKTLPLRLVNNYTRSMTYTFDVAQWNNYFAVTPSVINIDVTTKNGTVDVEFNAQDLGQYWDTLWVRFSSLGFNCTDSMPVLLHAISLPGIGFSIWLDSLQILNPRDRDVALDIYAQLDTNLVLPNVQLLLVLDLPNQIFMPRGVRARGGRILSFNSRTHDRHVITITVDTLLNAINNQPQVIAQLLGDAILGDRQCDSAYIAQVRWTNSGIKPTTWNNPSSGNGMLCLTLCGAGGARLLGSQLQLPLLTVAPNPTSDEATITIAANERGTFAIELVSLDGGAVLAKHAIGTLQAGMAYQYVLDMSRYTTGVYLLRLWTPSGVRTTPLVRIR